MEGVDGQILIAAEAELPDPPDPKLQTAITTVQNQAVLPGEVAWRILNQQGTGNQALPPGQHQQAANNQAVLPGAQGQNQQGTGNQALPPGQHQQTANNQAVLPGAQGQNQQGTGNQALPPGQHQQAANNQAVLPGALGQNHQATNNPAPPPGAPAQNQQADNKALPGQNQEVEVQITTGLDKYLKSNTDGKIILKAYKDSLLKKRPFKRTIRSKLVRLVIARKKEYLLRNITEDQFLQ